MRGEAPRCRPDHPASCDRGSTLLFFPACLLIVVVLASITVDFARVHLAQRAVEDAAAAAANDVVTVALDRDALRRSGDYRLEPERAWQVAVDNVARHRLGDLEPVVVRTTATGRRSVAVVVEGRVDLGFAAAVPGAGDARTVTGRAGARVSLR
jgi:hypothetical protein